MDQIVPLLGAWLWWIVAGILLFLELMAPGVFFIWLALAASAVGILDLVFDMSWQVELAVFCGFAVILVILARTWLKWREPPVDETPNLNRRMYDYVGGKYRLEQAISGGRGRILIDDTLWEALGPDLPRGAMVKVTGVQGLSLTVEAAS